MGSTGARIARTASPPIQAIAIHAATPMRSLLGRRDGGASIASMVGIEDGSSWVIEVSRLVCMPDPWVEDGVQDVDGEVHQDVEDRDDRDHRLERHDLTLPDGFEQ